MTKPSAKVILDSISPSGHRLTTMEVIMHRFILAEFNTHRAFSRNSASSRAIPIEKRIKDVMENPAMPIEWGSNKPGMQAGEELNVIDKNCAIDIWVESRNQTVEQVRRLDNLNLHKQVANRLLEPFLWHKALVSSTEWYNFFAQRASPVCYQCNGSGRCTDEETVLLCGKCECALCSGTGKLKSLAQPEMTALADAMREALNGSTPVKRNHHLPYFPEAHKCYEATIVEVKKLSTAMCASTSTYDHDGNRLTGEKCLRIYEKLRSANPPHMSPFEHVAVADDSVIHWQKVHGTEEGTMYWPKNGNFTGWKQYRYEVFGR